MGTCNSLNIPNNLMIIILCIAVIESLTIPLCILFMIRGMIIALDSAHQVIAHQCNGNKVVGKMLTS